MDLSDNSGSSCDGGCPGCSHHEQCPTDGLTGWTLAGAAIGAFLLPLACGIAGAALIGGSTDRKTLGGLGGLAVGVLIAILGGRLIAHRSAGKHPTSDGRKEQS
jgi:hypothetical protein